MDFLLPSLAQSGTSTAALVFSLRAAKRGRMLLSITAILGALGAVFVTLLTVYWP